MTPRNKKLLTVVLRAVIGIGVMLLVLRSVTWNDWATLAADGSQVRVLNWEELAEDPRLSDPAAAPFIHLQIEGEPGEITLDQVGRDSKGQLRVDIGLVTAWRSADAGMILLALLCFAPAPLLQSIRFTWMVRAQEIELSYWEGIKLSYAGNFLSFVALGSTGGDVFKAYYVSTHTDRKTEAVTTVLLDRAVGMVSLILIAGGLMLLRSDDPRIMAWFPIVALLMTGLMAGIFVAFSRRARARLRVDDILARLPFRDQIQRIDAATHRMRHHKTLLLQSLAITLLLQMLAITSFTLAGFGLGMQGGLAAYPSYCVYLALAMLAGAVPITYQGIGTMDGVLQVFMRGVYGSFSQVLFLGFAVRLVQLFWSLPGALVPLTGAHRPSAEKLAQLEGPG